VSYNPFEIGARSGRLITFGDYRMQLRSTRRRTVGRARLRAAIETLETRQMLSSYFIDTDAAYASLNSKDFNAGDVVLLKGGTTFHGQLYLDSADAGTSTNPVLITSYDPATKKAIADDAPASARATISAGTGDAIFAYNMAGVTISGINAVGSGASSSHGSGIEFYTDLGGSAKLTGVDIDHVDVSGFHSYGVVLGGGNGKSGYADVDITYVNTHDNGSAGLMTYGQFSSTSTSYANKDVYVGHVNAYNNAGFSGTNTPSGSGIVLSDVDGATIEYSTAYNNGSNNTNGNGPIGIWAYDANDVTIQYNESHHNHTQGGDGGGFDLDGGVTNSVMQYNYAHDNDGTGFGLYQYGGARTWANNTVRYNVASNDGLRNNATEISIWDSGSGMTNAQVYNNTLVVSRSSEAILWSQSTVTATIKNNTIQIGGVVDTSAVGVNANDVTSTPVDPVVTAPVITAPVVTAPVATPVITAPVADPVVADPVVADPVVTAPVATTNPAPTTSTTTDTTPVAGSTTTTTTTTTTKHRRRHWHRWA